VFILAVTACGSERGELSGFVREPLPEVGEFSLPDVTADGEAFEFVGPDDGLLVMYFGYTFCPDVCPTTMSDVRRALERLGGDAERVAVAMATVDPDRDTDEVVTGYVRTFVADGHALRTIDDAELRAVAAAFGADYQVSTNDSGEIEVAHTAALYAVDDTGRLLVTWPFGTSVDDLEADLRLLLESA
jgi:protein SCO1/2